MTETLDSATWLETCRELRRMGWRVSLVAIGPSGCQTIRGVEVQCIPQPQIYLGRQLVFHARVLRLVASEWSRLDVILFHQISALWLLPLRFVRRLAGRRHPLVVMDTRTVPMAWSSPKDWLRGWYYELMNRLANHWADGQTAITRRMAEAVRVPSDQLWGIWSSGVDVDLFGPARATRRWSMPGEPIHLVYVGLMHHERNLMPLCQAVEEANGEGMAFALSLIGDGTQRSDLEAFARQTQGRVRVLPPVPHDQVPELLAEADVGVLPFPDEEKFRVSSPIKLFEYMAAGMPILATRIDCHTDVVAGGDYAFWAEDASAAGLLAALRPVWANRASLEMMGNEAATAVQSWTWHSAASKLSAALQHGLAKSNDRRTVNSAEAYRRDKEGQAAARE